MLWAQLAAMSSICTASCLMREFASCCPGCSAVQSVMQRVLFTDSRTMPIDNTIHCLRREFSAVSARVETIVKERKDKLTGKPRAATADDYCSVSFTLEPRRSTKAAPLWGATAGDGSGNGSGSILVSNFERNVMRP